jgi:hypothetical protein
MQTDATDVRDPQRILTASLGEEVVLVYSGADPRVAPARHSQSHFRAGLSTEG